MQSTLKRNSAIIQGLRGKRVLSVSSFSVYFQKYRIVIISLVVVFIGLVYCCWFRAPMASSADGSSFSADSAGPQTPSASASTPAKSQEILFHIDGAVKVAGVYRVVTDNLYVYQALELAGGASSGADLSKINLASEVKTGQKISIPLLLPKSNPPQIMVRGTTTPADPYELVNLNQATLQDLRKVKGIGPVMAQKIIDYREKNGYFMSIEQLKKIDGIGEKTFKRLEKSICI